MRERIKARLDEMGMTARELGRDVGHDDAWISGILRGSQGLHWKDLDAVAEKLGITPSDLVRHDDSTVRELTPSEMRLLNHYREWPQTIRDRWLAMLDHFASQIPDRETAALLDRIRAHPKSLRRPVLSWLSGLLESGTPPGTIPAGGEPEIESESDAPATTHPAPKVRKIRGSRT